MDDRKGFGARIKAIREFRNLSIERAAEMCEASESIFKQYERGERLPSLSKLKSLCLGLKVKPEYFFGPELDELMEDMTEAEQLKAKIDQLRSDEIAVLDAAVSKRLELRNHK